ncbi:MAG: TlyA family RNA methyltransferase [Myxococcota bacterium]|nr:TlyA family RNA methyltransferase [Myxococcota bacterium]
MGKLRLDQVLVARRLAPSRTRAQAIVLAGQVSVNGKLVDKAGELVPEGAAIEVHGSDHPFVSRGGVKLAGALDGFGMDVRCLRCLDLGASTGGFTDCLLQRGATQVVAVDVGYGQLDYRLRTDPRVVVRERTNARTLTPADVGGAVDLTVVDASFIGLAKLLPAIRACTRDAGELLALVKPQFEVGRNEASRGKGVVRDERVRAEAIERALESVRSEGFVVLGLQDCTLPGPKGNVEAFVHAINRVPSSIG